MTVNYRHSGTAPLLSSLDLDAGHQTNTGTQYADALTFNMSNASALRTADTTLGLNYPSSSVKSSVLFNQAAGSHQVTGTLSVGSGTEYRLSGSGVLSTGTTSVVGTFKQSGGSHTASQTLDVDEGTYLLSGGTLTTEATNIAYGNMMFAHSGQFTQSGGLHRITGTLGVGSDGAYTLSNGTLTANSVMIGGTLVQSGGSSVNSTETSVQGTITHTGGTHSVVGSLSVSDGARYTLDLPADRLTSPTLNTGSTIIGNSNSTKAHTGDNFDQRAGTHTVAGTLTVGAVAGTNATYTLSAGSLKAHDSVVGAAGTGTFTHSAGGHAITGDLIVGKDAGGIGTYALSGGSLSETNAVVGLAGTGTFNQTGGTHYVANALTIGSAAGAAGTYLLSSGGVTTSTAVINGAGTLVLDGGSFEGDSIDQRGALRVTKNSSVTGDINLGSRSTTTVDAVLTLNGALNTRPNMLNGISVGGSGSIVLGSSSSIVGQGVIGVSVVNGGTILAKGGNLSLDGATFSNTGLVKNGVGANVFVTSTSVANAGNIEVNSAGAVVFDAAIANQAGKKVTLLGGTLATPTLTNKNGGTVTGFGTVTGNVVNAGSIDFYGPTNIVGNLDNQAGATMMVRNNQTLVTGHATNNGTIRTLKGTAIFEGGLTNNGAYISDPSDNYFTTLTVSPLGYLAGEAGDRFILTGNFDNHSNQAALWNTAGASLLMVGLGGQDLYLTGADMGRSYAGYANNFAWADLVVGQGASLNLLDGNATAGGAFYAGEVVGAVLAGNAVSNIRGNGFNLYYDPTLIGNAYLGARTYALGDGGFLAPVPEPETYAMFLAGLGLMGAVARRRKQRAA